MNNQLFFKNIECIVERELIEYSDAMIFMEKRVNQIIHKQAPSLIWLLQHNHIYTSGTGINEDEAKLIKEKISLYTSSRGGKVTYHGPGQLIVYLMLNLNELHSNKPDIHLFIKQLEIWIKKSLNKLNIESKIIPKYHGVWIENNGSYDKIAAIGIRIRKWITYHGIALNVSPCLDNFSKIIPCGISEDGYGVTSIKKLGYKYDMRDVIHRLLENFSEIFL